ncbi:type II secretion system F family protein [Candidatus Omnitrophota bacterium]
MPRFTYRARDEQGHESQGQREAVSEEELISRLQSDGLVVVSVTQKAEKKAHQAIRHFHQGVNIDDLILFSRQLATLLSAGVTLLKGLDVLSKQVESKRLLEAIEACKHDIASGGTFRDALAKHPKVFTEFWVHIVETGEASGALPVALAQLADYLESSAKLRRKVTSALIYPAILITLAITSLVVFSVWIIPIFASIFDTFDAELPMLTRIVIGFSGVMKRSLLFLIIGGFGLVYLLRKYIKTEPGRWQYDRLMLKLPIIATLVQRIAIEKFSSGLGTLIESGVPILYGLDIVSKAVGNKVVEQAVDKVRESVREGKGMAEPMEQSGVFTPIVVQMVAVGEEIGELGKMLMRISEFYKERVATTLERVTTLIEPLVLVFMGIVVGVMVISMFMPIFELSMLASSGG